ncbi:MAG: PIN domain-containing protein [Bacteroidia bacterium]
MRVYLDTNVLLDFFLKREPFYESSKSIIRMADEMKIICYTSPISISNIAYIMQKFGRDKVKNLTLKLLSIIHLTELDKQIYIAAFNSKFEDVEDALQYFSASKTKADVIITRNTKDFKHSSIEINTPEQFLNQRVP